MGSATPNPARGEKGNNMETETNIKYITISNENLLWIIERLENTCICECTKYAEKEWNELLEWFRELRDNNQCEIE